MHVKLTTSGGRRYVQLVESYRDEAGRVKKRTVATLGRAEQVDGSLDAVINGLLKITGREPMGAKPPAPTVSFESARALGNVWALTELWKSLGFSGAAPGVPPHAPHHGRGSADPSDGAQPPVRPRIQARRAALGTDGGVARLRAEGGHAPAVAA